MSSAETRKKFKARKPLNSVAQRIMKNTTMILGNGKNQQQTFEADAVLHSSGTDTKTNSAEDRNFRLYPGFSDGGTLENETSMENVHESQGIHKLDTQLCHNHSRATDTHQHHLLSQVPQQSDIPLLPRSQQLLEPDAQFCYKSSHPINTQQHHDPTEVNDLLPPVHNDQQPNSNAGYTFEWDGLKIGRNFKEQDNCSMASSSSYHSAAEQLHLLEASDELPIPMPMEPDNKSVDVPNMFGVNGVRVAQGPDLSWKDQDKGEGEFETVDDAPNLFRVNGVRVVRGPDWIWKNQDKGEGEVGTVEVVTKNEGGVQVVWDHGGSNVYSAGYKGMYDLRILDVAQIGVSHNAKCDHCQSGIWGIRWKCHTCLNYDLCTECYMKDEHMDHVFERILKPRSASIILPSRKGSRKIKAKGLFVGATVTQGRQSSEHASGVNGSCGTITEIGSWDSGGWRNSAIVNWKNGPSSGKYRVGHQGFCDLWYKEPGIWGEYYPKHLPVLDITTEDFSDMLTDRADPISTTAAEIQVHRTFQKQVPHVNHQTIPDGMTEISTAAAVITTFAQTTAFQNLPNQLEGNHQNETTMKTTDGSLHQPATPLNPSERDIDTQNGQKTKTEGAENILQHKQMDKTEPDNCPQESDTDPEQESKYELEFSSSESPEDGEMKTASGSKVVESEGTWSGLDRKVEAGLMDAEQHHKEAQNHDAHPVSESSQTGPPSVSHSEIHETAQELLPSPNQQSQLNIPASMAQQIAMQVCHAAISAVIEENPHLVEEGLELLDVVSESSWNQSVPDVLGHAESQLNSLLSTLGVTGRAKINQRRIPKIKASSRYTENTCTICLEYIQLGELLSIVPGCNHAFHEQCIAPWFKDHVDCPNCKQAHRELQQE